MPKRAATKKVFGGPQGEDAFVVIKRPTVEEAYQFNKFLTRLPVNGVSLTPDEVERNEQEARERFAEIVMDWNFVDDEDNPLPKPHHNPDAIALLLSEELQWIVGAILGNTPGEKKLTTT